MDFYPDSRESDALLDEDDIVRLLVGVAMANYDQGLRNYFLVLKTFGHGETLKRIGLMYIEVDILEEDMNSRHAQVERVGII